MTLDKGNLPDEMALETFELDVAKTINLIISLPDQPSAEMMHDRYKSLADFKAHLMKKLNAGESDLRVRKWDEIVKHFKKMLFVAASEEWDMFGTQKTELFAQVTTFTTLIEHIPQVRKSVEIAYKRQTGIYEKDKDGNIMSSPAISDTKPTHKILTPIPRRPENTSPINKSRSVQPALTPNPAPNPAPTPTPTPTPTLETPDLPPLDELYSLSEPNFEPVPEDEPTPLSREDMQRPTHATEAAPSPEKADEIDINRIIQELDDDVRELSDVPSRDVATAILNKIIALGKSKKITGEFRIVVTTLPGLYKAYVARFDKLATDSEALNKETETVLIPVRQLLIEMDSKFRTTEGADTAGF